MTLDYEAWYDAMSAVCDDCEICADCDRVPIEEYHVCKYCGTKFHFITEDLVIELKEGFCPRCGNLNLLEV
jgi:hypothetical protein